MASVAAVTASQRAGMARLAGGPIAKARPAGEEDEGRMRGREAVLIQSSREKNDQDWSGKNMKEKPYRSIVKAISWRATGTADTILISFLVTGQIKMAFSIGFVELFTKIFLYYVHERVWNRIAFGREKSGKDYEI